MVSVSGWTITLTVDLGLKVTEEADWQTSRNYNQVGGPEIVAGHGGRSTAMQCSQTGVVLRFGHIARFELADAGRWCIKGWSEISNAIRLNCGRFRVFMPNSA
jgi:hypothetical protein